MKNELKTSKDYIRHLKKKLDNTKFLSEKYSEINNEMIQEESKARELGNEIHEREEDIERRFRKYYPDKYYPYKK